MSEEIDWKSRAEAAEAAIREYAEITDGLRSRAEAAEAEVDALKTLCAGKHEAFVRLADIINPERDTDAFEAATRLQAEVARLKEDQRQGELDYCALQDRDDAKHVELCRLRTRIAELEAGLRIALNNHKTGCKCDCCSLLDGRWE